MSQDRRQFLASFSALAAACSANAQVQQMHPDAFRTGPTARGDQALGPLTGAERRNQCYLVRVEAARAGRDAAVVTHQSNGDERLYPNRIGNFTKGLPHNSAGEVLPDAYDSLITALKTGRPLDFENITMGAPSPALQMKLVNPQSGLAYDMEGVDSHQCVQPPAPALASAEAAGELVENYWMALARDVPFTDYDANPVTQAAAADLTLMSNFQGPKVKGQVTTGTLFRGFTPGDALGPWVSQFMWKPVPFGAVTYPQLTGTGVPGIDYLTSFSEWLSVQNGTVPLASVQYDPTPRYIRSARDAAAWVHVDVLYQAYFQAALILMEMGAPLNPGNPYLASATQTGFGTFGNPYTAAIVAETATRALKAVWFQKWFVHRRVRPEEMGGLLHNLKT